MGFFETFLAQYGIIAPWMKVKTIEEARLRHFIRQWRLSFASFFSTAVLVGIIIFGASIEVWF